MLFADPCVLVDDVVHGIYNDILIIDILIKQLQQREQVPKLKEGMSTLPSARKVANLETRERESL